jgi:hypothetical protein
VCGIEKLGRGAAEDMSIGISSACVFDARPTGELHVPYPPGNAGPIGNSVAVGGFHES